MRRKGGESSIVVLLSRVALCLGLAILATTAQGVEFRHALDDKPIDVTPRPNETVTEAVKKFHETGENPYNGDEAALAPGKKLYSQWCQSCHLPDGSGRMGPSLIGDKHNYPRMGTDVGMFEIVFAGAGGAMQPFNKRMSQDDILKVMAYVRSLKK